MLKVEKDPSEDLLVERELVRYLRQLIKDKKLDDSQATEILALEPNQLTSLLSGQPRSLHLMQLVRLMTRLGCEIDIVVTKSKHRKGLITVTAQ